MNANNSGNYVNEPEMLKGKLIQDEKLCGVGQKTYAPAIVDLVLFVISLVTAIISLSSVKQDNSRKISVTGATIGTTAVLLTIVFLISFLISILAMLKKYNLAVTDKRVLAFRGDGATISMPYEHITGIKEYKRSSDGLYGCGRIVIILGAQSYGFKYIKGSAELAGSMVQLRENFLRGYSQNNVMPGPQAAFVQQPQNFQPQNYQQPQSFQPQNYQQQNVGSHNNYVPYNDPSQAVVTAVRFCPNCGAKIDSSDAFCKSCGSSLK